MPRGHATLRIAPLPAVYICFTVPVDLTGQYVVFKSEFPETETLAGTGRISLVERAVMLASLRYVSLNLGVARCLEATLTVVEFYIIDIPSFRSGLKFFTVTSAIRTISTTYTRAVKAENPPTRGCTPSTRFIPVSRDAGHRPKYRFVRQLSEIITHTRIIRKVRTAKNILRAIFFHAQNRRCKILYVTVFTRDAHSSSIFHINDFWSSGALNRSVRNVQRHLCSYGLFETFETLFYRASL